MSQARQNLVPVGNSFRPFRTVEQVVRRVGTQQHAAAVPGSDVLHSKCKLFFTFLAISKKNIGAVTRLVSRSPVWAGFSFSLGASLWANTDRKRKELSVLKLLGFKSGRIVMFPVLQAIYTALLGWLLAVLVYLAFEYLINTFLAPRLNLDRSLCFLFAEHFLWALGLTIVVAIFAAILGGVRAARIEPSDGLRDI